jgi:hypothetical protein
MKTKLKVLGIMTLAILAAATKTQASTTNILQSVNIQLTIYSQGSPSISHTGTITTKIITSSLNTKGLLNSMTNSLGRTFSSKAYLALDTTVVPLVGPAKASVSSIPVVEGSTSLVVVDGTTIVPVPDTLLTFSSSAEFDASVVAANFTTLSQTSISAVLLTVSIPNEWNFTAPGIETDTEQNVTLGAGKKAETVHIDDAAITVAGSGTMGALGTPIIVSGKLSTTYLKTLIVP